MNTYTIKVTGFEHHADQTERSHEYSHEYDGVEYNDVDRAKEAAKNIDPKDFVGDLMTDFRGISGSISIEVMSWIGSGEEKDLDTWEEVDGCIVDFDDNGKTRVDGIYI